MQETGPDASLLHPTTACPTPGFTCKARLNDRPRSGRTSAPCLVQAVVLRRHTNQGMHIFSNGVAAE